MGKLGVIGTVAFLFASSPAPAEQMLDLPAALNGDWRITNAENPELGQGCDKTQRFAVSLDGKSVLLTEPWANFAAT